MLNDTGLAFQAGGYRLPSRRPPQQSTVAGEGASLATVPLAAWITGRFEDRGGGGASELFLPKVELISGGTLGEDWSYFAEWRIISWSLDSDGSLQDRSGRFEDLFAQWQPAERHAFKVGQYRALNQTDVSLRLSPSEPLLFNNGLPTGDHQGRRLAQLDRFSPAGRSPSVGYAYQSIQGRRPGDGLFHHLTVPFVGELSIPLSSEASENASFELADAKGVYAETFYRRGHRTAGAHAFYSDQSWLLTALGTYRWQGLLLTAGLGVDDRSSQGSRRRESLAAEYLWTGSDRLRAAAGLRIENVSDDGREVGFAPYFVVSGPNTQHTFLLQVEYQTQPAGDLLVLDLSLLF